MRRRVFVANFAFEATPDDLIAFFSRWGHVVTARIVRDDEGRSKGYGFVEYAYVADWNAALDEANGVDWCGRQLTVAEARHRGGGFGNGGNGHAGA